MGGCVGGWVGGWDIYGQIYPNLKNVFKIYRGPVFIKSWSHIFDMVCYFVMAMFVQAFKLSFNVL